MARKSTKISGLFAAGVSTPFRADSDGGVAIAEGEEYVEQLVFVALQPNVSDNPFQDLGITEHAVFKPADSPGWRLVMRRRIKDQFRILERDNLARFVRMDFGRGQPNGDLVVEVVYLNLETQKQRTITAAITPNGDVSLRPI